MICLLLVAVLGVRRAMGAGHELSVSNAWLRFIMSSVPAAGYFRLSNAGGRPQALVGADSPACAMLMLHESLVENGTARMVMLNSIEVPAYGHVDFTPGRYHLMCMSPSKEVSPGHQVSVTLRFADGAKVTTRFMVRGATGR